MGQDQSSPGSLKSPRLSPSSSATTQNKSILQSILLNQQQEYDGRKVLETDGITEEEEEPDQGSLEGIIQVVEAPEAEGEDEELRLMRSIKKFDPFIKEQEKGFSLDGLLGLKQSAAANLSVHREGDERLNPATEIFFELQSHIKEQMKHINNEQRILLRRIAYVDELSSHSGKSLLSAFNQAKLASEKVSEAAILKEQAAKAQENAINIFKSLAALEKYLDPEDRIQVTESSDAKWPELSHLRARAHKSTHPPFERLLKSSTTNDISTIGSSTSPLLEKIVVNGEAALPAHELTPEFSKSDIPLNQTSASPTSTSSLALSRLRGLSSRSINNLYTSAGED